MVSSSHRPVPGNTQHSKQTSMPPAGLEPSIPASKRPQAYFLDRLHDMYSSPGSNEVLKSRKIAQAGGHSVEKRNWYRVLAWKPEGKKVGRSGWIERAEGMVKWLACVNTVLNLRVPLSAGHFLSSKGNLASEEGYCFSELV